MQQVNQDAVTAQQGETAFILQLRPAIPPGADPAVLSTQIDQFVRLYLGACTLNEARFAQLEALTWAISASPGAAGAVEEIRADLAETLFGAAGGDHVRLVREDDHDAEPDAPEIAEPGPVEDPFAGWEPANSSAATRAAMEGSPDVLDLDAPDLDIVDADILEVDAWSVDTSVTAPPDGDVFDIESGFETEGESAEPSFDTLTEAPERSGQTNGDIAAELAAFRAEMRDIAAGIPADAGSGALDQFRAELDSITGALGQRVDGAAQRIESAADRVADTVACLPDAERMAGAMERAEASAQLMESSVREAVEALTAALKAMNGAAPGGENQADFGA